MTTADQHSAMAADASAAASDGAACRVAGPAVAPLTVRYFAALRERLGPGGPVDAVGLATVGALRAHLQARSAEHAAALRAEAGVRCAVNQRVAQEDTRLAPGDEVAFFPPVTGG